ncbi:MAG TPA: 3'(2'),5'-bisphosphate nucleotidase [Bacteroides sp.]|nr:3'(2'),5'-bisphosphate nucleotidase [Bacteroides sp.]
MKNEYTIATRAALRAGEAILEVYSEEDLEIETKADETPLTRADKMAHRIIREALEETGIPVLSEEGREIPYEERRGWEQFWMVDPLDGTKEFIKRNGEFTVNIALIEKGRTEFGVVFAPWINELFVGLPGMGSYRCVNKKHFHQPLDYLIQFSEKLPLEQEDAQGLFRVVASRSHFNRETELYIHFLELEGKKVSLVSRGSSLKLCMVATGEADVYPRMGPTMEWDTAAAHAVVKATGKNVCRFDTGEELEYNKEDLHNPFFLTR